MFAWFHYLVVSVVFLIAMALGAYGVYYVSTPGAVRWSCETIYSPLHCVEAYYSRR